jgi:hypothetical protein
MSIIFWEVLNKFGHRAVQLFLVSAQYFGEPEFMRTYLDSHWRWRNIQTSLLRAAKPRRYSHHGGELYNSAWNSP